LWKLHSWMAFHRFLALDCEGSAGPAAATWLPSSANRWSGIGHISDNTAMEASTSNSSAMTRDRSQYESSPQDGSGAPASVRTRSPSTARARNGPNVTCNVLLDFTFSGVFSIDLRQHLVNLIIQIFFS
jgi:hypothetical protein